MLADCLVPHLAVPLEHSKIKMSELLNLLRICVSLETFEDPTPVLMKWKTKARQLLVNLKLEEVLLSWSSMLLTRTTVIQM